MTQRERQSQRIVRSYGDTSVVECLHCHNYHHVPADDGCINQQPCQGSDSCTAMLCSACGGDDEAKCQHCGLHACSNHMKLNHDAGAGNGGVYARICDICAAKLATPEPEGITCDSCGRWSSRVPGEGRNFESRDESTGYHESGWLCQECAAPKAPEPVAAAVDSDEEGSPF